MFLQGSANLSLPFFNGLDLQSRKNLLKNHLSLEEMKINGKGGNHHHRWLTDIPWKGEDSFRKRLHAEDLTVNTFKKLVSASSETLANSGDTPIWIQQLGTCYLNGRPLSDLPLPIEVKNHAMCPFLNLPTPLIEQALEEINKAIPAMSSELPDQGNQVCDAIKTIHSMLPQLTRRIFNMISKTMVLELHIAKFRDELEGNTPEERFQNFVQQFENRRRSYEFLMEYPVLAHQLVVTVNHWKNFTLEFLEHLHQDFHQIVRIFFQNQHPGPLIDCDTNVGDGHRHGRSVILLKFASGKRLVYKPRSLSIDKHFYELLGWLNQKGDHPPFLELPILDRGHYGWMPFVHADSCQSEAEIKRFYQRQGGFLALLYAIEATDFHNENIIASGEHPILVDLESLFQPRVEKTIAERASEAIVKKIAFSVTRVGLLPNRLYSPAEKTGVDLSGMGARVGQLTPRKQPFWENPGRDDIRLARKHMEMAPSLNLPTLNGKIIEVLDYSEDVLLGFEKVYQTILQNREALLANDGPLMAFKGDDVRVIFRPTSVYSAVQHESYHPDALRNGLDRDRLFDQLWHIVDDQPFFYHLIPQELQDLRDGDIPFFSIKADELEIRNCFGKPLGYRLDMSGLSAAADRIMQMDSEDLKRQSWFVTASISTLAMSGETSRMASYPFHLVPREAQPEDLIEAACKLGDRILHLAVHTDDEVDWIGVTITPARTWVIEPLPENLYNGLAGIVLFLAHLGEMSGKTKYRHLAEKALTNLLRKLDNGVHKLYGLGAFSGWGSVIYVLSELARIWDRPELIERAASYLDEAMELLADDEYFDALYGAAGFICSLLSLYRVKPDPHILNMAIRCGEHLLQHQTSTPKGKGWVLPEACVEPLAGFSHGSAGIAWGLYHLADATGDMRYAEAAKATLVYERNTFNEELGNWPDLRIIDNPHPLVDPDETPYMIAWCHGATGVGAGRLGLPQQFRDEETEKEIRIAVKTLREGGFGATHCLCHGDLGNLDMMLLASMQWQDEALRKEVMQRAQTILESIEKHGPLCGIPLAVETPSFMNGLSGMGYQLLRLANPQKVPSILILESGYPNA